MKWALNSGRSHMFCVHPQYDIPATGLLLSCQPCYPPLMRFLAACSLPGEKSFKHIPPWMRHSFFRAVWWTWKFPSKSDLFHFHMWSLLDQKVICNINESGQKVILVPFSFVIMTQLQPLGATCSIAKYQRVILGETGCYAPEWWDMDVSDLLDK